MHVNLEPGPVPEPRLPVGMGRLQSEAIMYTLAADEKATTVMLYSRNKLVHGDIVTNKQVRVGTWPRMGMPNYVHLLNAEVMFLPGTPAKTLNYAEYFFPTERMIGFHLAPPSSEPLDYDPAAENRIRLPVELILGMFMLKGQVLIARRDELSAMLEISHRTWISIYDADITNPCMSIMPTMHVPMLLVSPAQVSFGL